MSLFIWLNFFSLFLNADQNLVSADPNRSADEVLKKMSDKLNSIRCIQYKHRRELNYPSKSFYNELNGKVYLDFTSPDKVIGTRYFFEGDNLILAFNGSESFICQSKNHSIDVNRNPEFKNMRDLSFLNHSILSLKKSLPWIIADQTIPKITRDTTLGGRSCFKIIFTLKNKVIGTLGEQSPLTDTININYSILVDKNNYLPIEIIQTNGENQDLLKTDFTEIEINKELEDESILYYTSYLDKYKESTNTVNPLIKPGEIAKDWKLMSFNSNEPVSLSDYKGKLVLLDFWICHCGPCIASIKDLNLLYNKYKDRNFKLVSINAYDSPEMIKSFIQNRKPIDYEILTQGEEVRLKYGVPGFPTVILLDKKGVVLYAGGFNSTKIEELINKNL
jgi:thiol-disulfide isomerase/thioredoxin